MKTLFSLLQKVCLLLISFLIFCACCCSSGWSQTNSWTNPASGNWQDTHWSLGILPGAGQTVLITNAGFKAVAIAPSTVQNDPQTLTIAAFTIASPTNSFNTLLLNFAGVQNPLVITNTNLSGAFIVNSNCAVTVLSSALQVRNTNQDGSMIGAFSIGGNFTEDVASQVTAGFMNLGDIGPGVFVLTNNSTLTVNVENVGSFPGTFNQESGTNNAGFLELAGNYNMFGGLFSGEIDLRGGTFTQTGGAVSADLEYTFGFYILTGGTLSCPQLNVPSPPGTGSVHDGTLSQNGGTNFIGGPMVIGFLGPASLGTGQYTLSNGTMFVSGTVTLGPPGTFAQWGGLQTNSGINVTGALDRFSNPEPSSYTMGAGTANASEITVSIGTLTQSGGTNFVNGTVTLNSSQVSIYQLSGGSLDDINATVNASADGGFLQSGGVHIVTNLLTISGQVTNSLGYILSGGQLTAPNLQVIAGGAFHHTGGAFMQSGTFTLAGTWDEHTAAQQFGQLQLTVLFATNSTLSLPASGACILHFAASSGQVWSNQAVLTIQNWSGSLSGGGSQQVIFGSNATALTTQQLSQIQFLNPAGVPPGTYPAQILSTGEITPGRALTFAERKGQLVLQWGGGAILQTSTNVLGPYTNVTGATSPYTNSLTGPRRFFRLKL